MDAQKQAITLAAMDAMIAHSVLCALRIFHEARGLTALASLHDLIHEMDHDDPDVAWAAGYIEGVSAACGVTPDALIAGLGYAWPLPEDKS